MYLRKLSLVNFKNFDSKTFNFEKKINCFVGQNGVGKTTLLRCLIDEMPANKGVVKWSENASFGYCPQDSTADFDCDLTLFEWMSQWRTPKHDDLQVRAMLGRLLFTEDDFN